MDIVVISPSSTANGLVKQLDRNRYNCPVMLVMAPSEDLGNQRFLFAKAFIYICSYTEVVLVLKKPNPTYRDIFYPWRADFEEVRSILLESEFEQNGFDKLYTLIKEIVDAYGSTHAGLVSAFKFVGVEDIYQHLLVS